MKVNLLFDFTVDKSSKTVIITKEFASQLPLIWDAFTKQEFLDQWWAPKPWRSKTKSMDFKEGGRRFYAMIGPEGQEAWAIQDYSAIDPKNNFQFLNVFADKDENPHLPGSHWELNFSEQDHITKATITIKNDSLERMEKLLEMGFQEGFTATLKNLETLITHLKNQVH